jgi:hypothetical protein
VKIICPILAIRALYELIVEVIILGDININGQGLTLADVLIQGLSYLVVFNVALALGLLPKSDEQDSEQHSAQED